jgi:hypothetical protein
MLYRVEVAGRIFESVDPRTLVRLAVQVTVAAKLKRRNDLNPCTISMQNAEKPDSTND